MKICNSQNRNLLLDIIDIAGCDDLYNIDIEQSAGYSKIIFSVFDHWLNEDEAETLIVLYDEEIFQKDNKKQKVYFEYEKVFLEFYTKLYSEHKIYLTFSDTSSRTIFFEFDSAEDLMYHISSAVREDFSSALIIPDLHSVIFNWLDYTHCIYVKETTYLKSDINTLNKLIQDSGLNILPSEQRKQLIEPIDEVIKFKDPNTGQYLKKDAAVNSAFISHGCYWRLYDKKDKRIGSVNEQGIWLRK